MMTQDFLLAAGVCRIVGSGTAVVKNTLIQQEIESQYKLPLILGTESVADAAVGAAMAMIMTPAENGGESNNTPES